MARSNAMDAKFAREAAMGGMMEVELGKVALQKAASDKVKQRDMVKDHTMDVADFQKEANNGMIRT